MKKPFRTKEERILWAAAVILLLLLVGYTIYSLSFLGQKINAAILTDLGGDSQIQRFDFDKLNDALRGKTGF